MTKHKGNTDTELDTLIVFIVKRPTTRRGKAALVPRAASKKVER